jgi:hypothetical protein
MVTNTTVLTQLGTFYVAKLIVAYLFKIKLLNTILSQLNQIHVLTPSVLKICLNVDKKDQLDVTFCILYFSSNSCSTCFGQPCAHHQEPTTA